MDSQFLKMQPATAKLVNDIKEKRLEKDNVKDSKARIVAEAVNLLAEKELNG